MCVDRETGRKFVSGRKWGWLFFLLLGFQMSVAQTPSRFTLVTVTPQKIVLRFKGEPVGLKKTNTPMGTAFLPVTPNGVPLLTNGTPGLPRYAVSLEIPPGSCMSVQLLSSRFHEIKNILIAPSRGKVYRSAPPDSLPRQFGPVYLQNAFYPQQLWETGKPYFLRKQQGQTLRLTPFQYHPLRKTLRVYDEITLEITFRRENKQAVFRQVTETAPPWETVFRHHFLNAIPQQKKTAQETGRPGLLIVSYGPFVPLLKDFIHWKKQCGFRVWVTKVDAPGNADSIKTMVQSLYRKHNIAYLLLVGDAPQVPAGTMAGNPSDNFYAYVAGNDRYPDLFTGRFSAETPEQLTTMLRRTLQYEKAQFADTAGYKRAIGIASELGPGYHNLTDYAHIRFIDSAYLLASTYRQVTELFDGSQGGLDAAGDPNTAMLTQAIEQGAGLINYCGHGSTLGWNTTRFGNAQVEKLQNSGCWPVIFSVSCATGDFVHQACFAEKWLRASSGGRPTGAVALLMPSATQSWKPPMCAQQEMNRLLTAPDSLQPPRTFGNIVMQGCLKMNDEFGADGYETTDSWVVFGDPSLRIRTTAPQNIQASFPATVPDTSRFLTVSTNLPAATATLSDSTKVYAVATADNNGTIRLPTDSLPTGKPLQLVITAFNHRPLFGSVTIGNTTGLPQAAFLSVSHIFPNPVKAGNTSTLMLSLARKTNLKITVLDARGRKIRLLFSGPLPAGRHRFSWVPEIPGLYFIRLKTTGESIVKKILVR